MPEGDTVWLSAQRLDRALAGHILTRTDFRVPRLATVDLTGRRVLGVTPRGKHMLTRLEGGLTVHTHFRMDGAWRLYRAGTGLHGGPGWQVRVVLGTEEWEALGYRLPVVELLRTAEEQRVVGHLGPDVLGPDWDVEEVVRRLSTRADREIGPALLDQRVLAGVGNLYKSEALFLAGISPWARVGNIRQLPRLVGLVHRLMEANRRRWEQVTTGDRRPGREHWVFERSGRQCRRCGTVVRSGIQGEAPEERISYWCASCQPGPLRSAAERADE
jgi:endonuclease VIII